MRFTTLSPFLLYLFFTLFIQTTQLECNNKFNAEQKKKKKTSDPQQSKDPQTLKLAEQKFLEFMGMTSRPDIELKRTVKVPRAMWELYHKWNNDTHNDNLKNDVDTVSVIDEEIGTELQRIAQKSLRFNLSRIRRSETFRKAELHIFTADKSSSRSSPSLKGTKHLKIYARVNEKDKPTLARVTKIPRNMIGYVKVDITRAVDAWMADARRNDTFHVEARQSDDENDEDDDDKGDSGHLNLRKPRSISQSIWFSQKPRLFIYSKTSSETRQSPSNENRESNSNTDRIRRSNSNNINIERIRQLKVTHNKAQKETCRLRPYKLNFKKLGWDAWIIAPMGYPLNFCTGECPRPLADHYNTTNHAVIQNSVLRIDKTKVPPLCCIPTNYRDQTFLYMDNSGEIKLKSPSRMVATACGCR